VPAKKLLAPRSAGCKNQALEASKASGSLL